VKRVIQPEANSPATVEPPPGNPRFPLLDGLRAVAATFVLIFHVFSAADGHESPLLRNLSQEGIAIFFVLSGFLLYGPFVRARLRGRGVPSVRDYARRRVLRIFPAYWLALTFALLVAGASSATAAHVPVYYLLLQDYLGATRYQGLGVAWTLSIEATFYAALPVLAYVAVKLSSWTRGRWRLLPESLIVAGFIAISAGVHVLHPGAPATILSYTDWFAGGMLLALITVAQGELRSLSPSLSIGLWLIGAALFVGETKTTYGSYGGHLLWIGSAVAIVAPAVFPADRGVVAALLRTRVLGWLGVISYAIYLWHIPVLSVILKIHHVNAVPLLVLTAAITVLVAAASYRFVEAPLLRFARKPAASELQV
jgi:peptidoglycan/LPS O-acetylase OafA/YrhL